METTVFTFKSVVQLCTLSICLCHDIKDMKVCIPDQLNTAKHHTSMVLHCAGKSLKKRAFPHCKSLNHIWPVANLIANQISTPPL